MEESDAAHRASLTSGLLGQKEKKEKKQGFSTEQTMRTPGHHGAARTPKKGKKERARGRRDGREFPAIHLRRLHANGTPIEVNAPKAGKKKKKKKLRGPRKSTTTILQDALGG